MNVVSAVSKITGKACEESWVGKPRTPTAEKLARYLKTVKIDGNPMSAIIDPGSSDCTIKATAVLCHDLKVIRLPSVLGGFDKPDIQNLVSSCGIVRVSVKADEVEAKDVMFPIVPDDVQSTEVLIERTFTELEHVAYLKVDDRLVFVEKSTLELSNILPVRELDHAERLVVSRDSVLPPGTVNFVQVRHEGTTTTLPLANLDSREKCLWEGVVVESNVLTVDQPAGLQRRESPIEDDEIAVDEMVSSEQRQQLKRLLEEFRDCVAQNIHEIGKTSLLKMDIREKPSSVPVSTKPYKTNCKEREAIREIVTEWKDTGVVRETTSLYATPILLVTKKNGEKRLVVDYGKLNSQTERIYFPLPSIDEYLEVISGVKIFATLDLAHSYLQLPLTEEASAKQLSSRRTRLENLLAQCSA